MRAKLRNSQGETLVEVLASVLVCALSVMLLLGAVTASANINLQAQAADAEYYTALTKAERQDAGDNAADIPALSVQVEDTTPPAPGEPEPPPKPPLELDCVFYGSKSLLSYAAKQTPPAPDPVPGPGGSG